MPHTRRHLVAAMCICVCLSSGSALAGGKDFADKCEGGTFLDISRVAHMHVGSRLAHELQTCESWAEEDLSNKSNLKFHFDVDGDDKAERILKVDVSSEGDLYAVMWNKKHKEVGSAEVSRPDSSTVRVTFKPSLLGRKNLSSYRWNAMTVAHGGEDPNDPLTQNQRSWDYVPGQRGKFMHRL